MHNEIDKVHEAHAATVPRTTAAGLEAWLSGVHADPAGTPVAPATTPADDTMQALVWGGPDIGPVNAAEALILGKVSGARRLVGVDGAELVIDPDLGHYYFESALLKPLAALLQQPSDHWVPVYLKSLNATRAAYPARPLERLRWYAGLIATPGILGRQLHRGERYKLKRWPETEREFPRHLRVARAMLQAPVDIAAIVATSGLSHEEVTDYINASYAADRLEATSASGSDALPPSMTPRKRRLLPRLNKKPLAR